MEEHVKSPQYLQIALDIAFRIARGDLKENQKIYGRSAMAAEYGVSPETIRRAMKLLSDMQVVDVLPKSGIVVHSMDRAQQYIERFGKNADIRSLQGKLKKMIADHAELGQRIAEAASNIAKLEDKVSVAAPFRTYEVQIGENAKVVGKNIGEMRFWQATGATVIAIRREGNIILSPGPYAQLCAGDIVIFIGDLAAVAAAEAFVSE